MPCSTPDSWTAAPTDQWRAEKARVPIAEQRRSGGERDLMSAFFAAVDHRAFRDEDEPVEVWVCSGFYQY